ncbi:MAG: amino-acid N-acetyltransferase [Desulfovibrionales bacterium]|jgi:amino-acid N-acetyltransferase|nr:amino-acid N-acetyltransferase [Desulfovibrionales bacterium]
MTTTIRKARIQDVKPMHALINEGAARGDMLPRSVNSLYTHLRDMTVAAEGDGLVGCCGLSICWEDLAEVRSLVVRAEQRGLGVGRKLVESCLSEAVTLGIYRVFTLTYVVDFFRDMGFTVVNKDILPQKIWADCLNCHKFPDCDETAMLIEL